MPKNLKWLSLALLLVACTDTPTVTPEQKSQLTTLTGKVYSYEWNGTKSEVKDWAHGERAVNLTIFPDQGSQVTVATGQVSALGTLNVPLADVNLSGYDPAKLVLPKNYGAIWSCTVQDTTTSAKPNMAVAALSFVGVAGNLLQAATNRAALDAFPPDTSVQLIYADAPAKLSGTVSCSALPVPCGPAGGTLSSTYNLDLLQGWNAVKLNQSVSADGRTFTTSLTNADAPQVWWTFSPIFAKKPLTALCSPPLPTP